MTKSPPDSTTLLFRRPKPLNPPPGNGDYSLGQIRPCIVLHECHSRDKIWLCSEFSDLEGCLVLQVTEEDYENEILVQVCPFCGYTPKAVNDLDRTPKETSAQTRTEMLIVEY